MDIRVKATDYQITPETRSYLDDRLAHLEKFLGGDAESVRCEVELGRDAGRPRHGANIWFAEIRIIMPGQDAVYARNNSESVNGAIDDVKQEIERQLRREKQVHMRVLRKGGAAVKRLLRLG